MLSLLQTNRSPLHFSTGSHPITSIFHRDDSLLTQSKGGVIKSWNIVKSGYELGNQIDGEHLGYCKLQCIPEHNMLISPRAQNDIVIHNLNDLKIQGILSPSSTHDEGNTLGALMCMKLVKFSDQLYILAAYESGNFLTWDLRSNTVINTVKFEESPMTFDFCCETNRGIYGNASNTLGIFGYIRNEMKLMKHGNIPIKNPGINCVRIRRDQKIFCSGGWDGRVRVFSWKSLRPLTVLTDHKGAITDIDYSNSKVDLWNSPIMATSATDGQVSLWSIYN